jgi:hypothetical protein
MTLAAKTYKAVDNNDRGEHNERKIAAFEIGKSVDIKIHQEDTAK